MAPKAPTNAQLYEYFSFELLWAGSFKNNLNLLSSSAIKPLVGSGMSHPYLVFVFVVERGLPTRCVRVV